MSMEKAKQAATIMTTALIDHEEINSFQLIEIMTALGMMATEMIRRGVGEEDRDRFTTKFCETLQAAVIALN